MDREEFIKKMKRQLDELNYRYSIERDKFEAKAQHLSADAKKTFEKELEKLQELRKEMKEKLVDLDVAGENAWHDVKEGAEEAWKALSKAFKKASSHFK
jgi:Skp family chaperone for outer membrane proteins